MDRQEKKQAVVDLKDNLSNAEIVVIVHYIGLTVQDITNLRRSMLELGAVFKVTKNSLAKRAVVDTPFEKLSDFLSGPTAIAYSNDPVAAAKGVVNFSKDNDNLVILGAVFNGEEMDVSSVQALAKLPSLDELRAKLIAMINTPATRIAGVVQAPGGQIARVLNAYSQKSE